MNRTIKCTASLAFAAAIALAGVSPANALRGPADTSVARLTPGASMHAPLGFQLFCLKSPQFCKGGGAGQVAMDANLMRVLKTVNARVNRAIRPRRDRGDVWSINVRSGDCEDYALTKRQQLIEAGVAPGALRLATARTNWGEGHAVLVVRTNAGDFVLDNRTSSIKPWNRTGLRWISMASANPRKWNAI